MRRRYVLPSVTFYLKTQLKTDFGLGQVTISMDDTIVLNGGGDKKLIEERCEEV